MKTRSITIIVSLLLMVSSLTVSGQLKSFSGEWKLNREKTQLQGVQLFLSKLKVEFRNDSLLSVRVYETGSGEEYPFNENISLDGKDCKIVIYEMPRTSKASYSASDGVLNVESITTFNGGNGEDNNKTKEIWKIGDGGKTLSVESSTTTSSGSVSGTYYFDKVN